MGPQIEGEEGSFVLSEEKKGTLFKPGIMLKIKHIFIPKIYVHKTGNEQPVVIHSYNNLTLASGTDWEIWLEDGNEALPSYCFKQLHKSQISQFLPEASVLLFFSCISHEFILIVIEKYIF